MLNASIATHTHSIFISFHNSLSAKDLEFLFSSLPAPFFSIPKEGMPLIQSVFKLSTIIEVFNFCVTLSTNMQQLKELSVPFRVDYLLYEKDTLLEHTILSILNFESILEEQELKIESTNDPSATIH